MLNKSRMANWLAPFLENSPISSQEELADKLGKSRATINRMANDHSKLKMDRAKKMAPLLGVTAEDLMLNRFPASEAAEAPEVQRSAGPLVSAPLAGTVEAGTWREVDELDQSDAEWISLPPDDRFPNATQEVYDVSGDSMNDLKPYPIYPGARVVTIRYDDVASRLPLRNNMVVVVQRSRDGGHVRELSIKQVEWHDDRIEFCPRSTNPKHKPIVVMHDAWEDNGTEVEVLAVVRRTMNEMPL